MLRSRWRFIVAVGLAVSGCTVQRAPSVELGDEPTQFAVAEGSTDLVASSRRVVAIDRGGTLREVWSAPGDELVRVELAPNGERFGVQDRAGFRIYDRDGLRIGELEAAPTGLRHKLIGNGTRARQRARSRRCALELRRRADVGEP